MGEPWIEGAIPPVIASSSKERGDPGIFWIASLLTRLAMTNLIEVGV